MLRNWEINDKICVLCSYEYILQENQVFSLFLVFRGQDSEKCTYQVWIQLIDVILIIIKTVIVLFRCEYFMYFFWEVLFCLWLS
jgi:hypothetical protein